MSQVDLLDKKGFASIVENQYILPLPAIVEIMKQYPMRVVLHAALPYLPSLSKEPCLAHIQLGTGTIFSCTITTKETILLQQQAAYDVLERCGDLEWEVEPASLIKKGALPTVTSRCPIASSIPRLRVPSLTQNIRATLSHSSFQALLLIDGHRSLEDIARLTSKTTEEVQALFATMKHLIDF